MPNVTHTIYLKTWNGDYERYCENRAKYNAIGTKAMKEAIAIDDTITEEDLLDVAKKEEDKEKEQLKDVIEETPIKEVINIGQKDDEPEKKGTWAGAMIRAINGKND